MYKVVTKINGDIAFFITKKQVNSYITSEILRINSFNGVNSIIKYFLETYPDDFEITQVLSINPDDTD